MGNIKVKFICEQCGNEFYRYMSKGGKNKYCSKKCNGISKSLNNHPRWKGGISFNKEEMLKYYRMYYAKNKERILKRVSEHSKKQEVKTRRKKYNSEYNIKNKIKLNLIRKNDRSINPEKYRLRSRNYRKNNLEKMKLWERCNGYKRRSASSIIPETIQRVYEDNIKKYGTLTCVLCNRTINFGQDSIEHLNPITRGGTNEYENLAIAHRSCNSAKNNKTLDEWVEYRDNEMERLKIKNVTATIITT